MRNNHEENFARLNHILKALNTIEEYTSEIHDDGLANNEMLFDAVLLQFIIIGEAIMHVEKEMLEKHNYPWFKVRAFRNFIAHEYFDIVPDAVWKIIRKDVPELKKMVENIILIEF